MIGMQMTIGRATVQHSGHRQRNDRHRAVRHRGARPAALALALALVMPFVGVTGGAPASAEPVPACPLLGVDLSPDAAVAGSVDNPHAVADKNDLVGIGLCDGAGVHFEQPPTASS